jgi:integrase/recombinase XerD
MTVISPSGAKRRCRPLEEWPQWDRRQWQTALQAGDLLEEGGCRAERSRCSNRAMEKGYGRWLAWLGDRGLLDEEVPPGDRITADRVRAYAEHLEGENASATAIARLIELKVMASIMDSSRDWSWIYRMASAIRTRHKPARPKRHRVVPIVSLFELGIDLMAGAEDETTALRRFKSYRDGLLIAFLAARPLRLRNLTGLVLDHTLIRRGDSWWIQVPAAETKTKAAIEVPWPELLAPHLGTYLADHRAAIAALRGLRSNSLWLSMHGSPMNDNAIYIRIVARTREGLGQPIHPHLFRDCAATSVAIDDPAHVDIARCLLGHRTGSTTEPYYNQARSLEASRLTQKHLLALRNRELGALNLTDTIS